MIDVKIYNLSKKDAIKISLWKSDKKLSELIMSNYSKTSIKDSEKWIVENSSDINQKLFGIYITNNIGKTKIIGISRLMFIDNKAKNCEFGVYIGDSQYRGLGIGKKATNLTFNFGFKNMMMNKIYLKVREDNIGAVELYKKLGFETEGILKDHFYQKGEFINILYMSIFKEKYNK